MPYSLKEVNDAVRSDPKGFAEACDAAFAKKVENAAQKIADHRRQSHIILLSGPSGSGKTTTALKIEEVLERMGISTHTISMDNYFKTIDPDTAPRNREGQIDYESPFCLDVDLLNRHFSMLDGARPSMCPSMNSPGKCAPTFCPSPCGWGPTNWPSSRASTPSTTSSWARTPRPSSCISPPAAIWWTRTAPWCSSTPGCRRIVRDHLFRGSNAAFTLKMWPNVHRGERLYISPYKESADIMFDSSLAFEFSVLKPIVTPLLEELPAGKYPEADQMLEAFRRIEPMDESYIAPESLAREFIGGSTYDNH